MRNPKLRRELLLAIIFSSFYLTINVFRYHLDKILQGIGIEGITLACFIILLLLLGIQIFKVIRRRKKSKGRIKLKFVYYLPAIILLVAILYTFSPIKFNSEKLESPIITKGCYEGGNSHAIIKFRANKKFEIKWTVESGADEWYFGTYKNEKDTLMLTYFDRFPEKFGSIVLNTGQSLSCIDR